VNFLQMEHERAAAEQFEATTRERAKKEYIALAKELHESKEVYPFPGIDPESYQTIKAEDQEYPGYTTPIDEILEKLKAQGMKVVLSTSDPESGNIFILPSQSEDMDDSLFPKHLTLSGGMDDKIKRLILAHKEVDRLEKLKDAR
jgi:hypothetical protein